ncbi:DEAD/DEAH box helicase [Litoribrevibacter albus]|uniref:ATP-dependent RNA helicase DeaD n=1 Tax=Litoribrevibacter albus TaxID=1473156 RepID=A0AA37W7K6_9GAMM|nr:DEAD/DEAH box helicase [Litoribrevibacter albus]GLQ32607.1 ATP-dependent RNA helicase DeaD [Litoribrevibacter albus]
MSDELNVTFGDLGLPDHVLKALKDVGYETPSPIQAETIPYVMEGHDVLGQAQTGTGKTAAFAVPLVANINIRKSKPQALVLAPTRELAIQVAEAFQKYAARRKGFHVLPIYGGQDYSSQIRALKRGVHVVVGTPGRVMDHMRRGTLDLSDLQTLVLDEADEMLRMGFIDDVEWILEQTPEQRQIALFSATMPKEIKRIATNYLNDPKEVTIKVKTQTASTIRQRVWMVSGMHKLDALTRILETEPFDGMIMFVRTKNATEELAEKLEARGYSAAALNGDMAQQSRARTVERLKNGQLDILIATDVAARGLDVERITHVINYDIPYDTEAYVHRIGRTGRAGRSGEAILFAAPRERRMLRAIERATNKTIEEMTLPSTQDVNDRRVSRFKDRITEALGSETDLQFFQELIEQYQEEKNIPALEIAAALAKLVQGDEPLLLKDRPKRERRKDFEERDGREGRDGRDGRGRDRGDRPKRERGERQPRDTGVPMEEFRMEIGRADGVEPKHIVGAIANEADIESRYIGSIDIHEDHSYVSLPEGMPAEVFEHLKGVRIVGKQMRLAKATQGPKPKKGRSDRGRSGDKPRGDKPRGDKRLASKGRRPEGEAPKGPRKPRKPRKTED